MDGRLHDSGRGEPQREFDRWHAEWRSDGPSLTIEFSRISVTRNGALTLVIDAGNPVPAQVSWCMSSRGKISDAVEDLRKREGMTNCKRIGRYPQGRWQPQPEKTGAFKGICDWARSRGLSAVWTDLESNFWQRIERGKLPPDVRLSSGQLQQMRGQPFDQAAIAYLRSLTDHAKTKAFEYILRAPSFVRTPLRREFERRLTDRGL